MRIPAHRAPARTQPPAPPTSTPDLSGLTGPQVREVGDGGGPSIGRSGDLRRGLAGRRLEASAAPTFLW